MAGETPAQGVTSVERVEVTPAEGDEDVITPEGTEPESPPGNEGTQAGEEGAEPAADPGDDSPDGRPEGLRRTTPPSADSETGGAATAVVPPAPATEHSNPHGLKRLPNESVTEFARRCEIADLRGQLRSKRTGEFVETLRPGAPAQAGAQSPLDERTKAVLAKYPKEQLDALREVFPAIATEMGFVRKDEIAGSSYADKAQEELDGFLERHPEYTPEKDQDGSLWARFTKEFGQYKQPANPKDYRKLFEKVHQEVFGIQPGGALPNHTAATRKVQVASHAGASGPTAPARQTRPAGGSNLRLDMLKGFDEETKQRIAGRAAGD